MKQFYHDVDKRSKKAMVEFLANHFRYHTSNSWNNSTSYANNMKVNRLGLDREIESKIFELMNAEGFYDDINDLCRDFDREHNYQWQVGFNGRSGGYLVLYQGGSKQSEYKSHCTKCGQKNFRFVPPADISEEELKKLSSDYTKDNKCGACGKNARVNYVNRPIETFTYPGKGTDMGEDFSEWDMDSLKARVQLVQEFDKLCDNIVQLTIEMANSCEVKEEVVYIPKTVKSIQCKM